MLLKFWNGFTRQSDQIGQHVSRFHDVTGKYRNVPTKAWLTVDCRGPKTRAVKSSANGALCISLKTLEVVSVIWATSQKFCGNLTSEFTRRILAFNLVLLIPLLFVLF